ncbi:SigB/SigF/SigG family RNA polymerase sigma factor [Mycobacterium sp. SMC-8]|uniref:SigB/SigF/SigG family RNA polymerase sigma factor n=1 Tax=Mycobacterium sp. SMC-8 TaxID=2857060 RepID=UPI0021B33A52|nr:SigB/SigF/SigG family RNA polymerase sigma factor [Mycobacterium sp. SMC-8]UXA10827.1 SigB/SigF/SigG family RNA polymerase sigma factor [Mycobacterium sp. SMC-8]
MSSGDELDFAWIHAAFVRLRALPPDSADRGRLRDEIIRRCLPVADRIARRYDHRGETHDDLVQVARVGLVNSVNRFDPAAGPEFLSFAIPTMLGEVKRYFRDCGWAVNVPRRLKDLYPSLAPASAELTQRLGRSPNAAELAALLEVDRMEVAEALTAAAGFKTRSIDAASTSGEDSPSLADRLGDPDPALDLVDECDELRAQLASLPRREYRIVIMRFFESLTQTEIAERMGMSQMHVSRLLAQSLRRLRSAMGGADDAAIA